MRTLILPLAALLALGLFAIYPAQAQVKSGYKHFQKKNYEKAEAKFHKALPKPVQTPAARFGLFRLQEKDLPLDTYQILQRAFFEVSAIQAAFDSLPEKRKQYYARQKWIQLTAADFTTAKGRLQRRALELIEGRDTLLLLDSFYLNMQPLTQLLQKDYEALEDSLVMHNLFSEDYETLRSIIKNHRHVLDKHQLAVSRSFARRLLLAFLREYPLYRHRRFVDDFPGHWASADCYIEPFLQAVESRKLAPLARRELDWMARYFVHSRQTLLVGGHSDGEGSPAAQEALSLARAEAVKAYLISRGLPWDRIWTQGFADKKPLDREKALIALPSNRRIEIFIKKP